MIWAMTVSRLSVAVYSILFCECKGTDFFRHTQYLKMMTFILKGGISYDIKSRSTISIALWSL